MAAEEALKVCQILANLNFDGQQTLISPELFLNPNFSLVCDILRWSAKIIDDSFIIRDFGDNLSGEITESSIVTFLVDMGRLFMTHLGAQVNLVALYKADLAACCELLKVVQPIFEAAKLASEKKASVATELTVAKMLETNQEKLERTLDYINGCNLKEISLRVVQSAIDLENLLNEEEKINEERLKVIDRQMEVSGIEQLLRDAHEGVVLKTKELGITNEELEKDLLRLDERLRVKEFELDETKDRLNDLLIQSPTYMEEYERLNQDYETAYEKYVSRFRNLMYLKSCVYSAESTSSEDENDVQAVDDYQLEKPVGSTGSSAGLDAAAEVRSAEGPFAPDETTGPARLLESLFEGASKPKSASFTGDAVVPRVEAATSEGLARFTAAGDAGGRRTYVGRTGGTMTGLELEGLLNEFVEEESAAATTATADSDESGGADPALDGTSDENDDDEDEDEDDDEPVGRSEDVDLNGVY